MPKKDPQTIIRNKVKKLIAQKTKAEKKVEDLSAKLKVIEQECSHPNLKTIRVDSHWETECPDCNFWLWHVKEL